MLLITPAILLIVYYASLIHGTCFDAGLEDTIVRAHNDLRRDVATKNLSTKIYGDIPGSMSMFNMEFDCGLAQLAEALIPNHCLRPALEYSSKGHGSNFRKFRTPRRVDDSDYDNLKAYYNIVVQEWAMKDNIPLGSDVIYKDERMQAFANLQGDETIKVEENSYKTFQMVYYKTVAFGCKHRTCNDTTFAIACVYESLPKTGEPLFEPNPQPKNKKGCTAHKPCKQIRPEAKCMQKPDGTLGPLCVLHDITTTSSTASTSSTTTTTTPAPTTTPTTTTTTTPTTISSTTTTSTTPTTISSTTTTSTTPTTTSSTATTSTTSTTTSSTTTTSTTTTTSSTTTASSAEFPGSSPTEPSTLCEWNEINDVLRGQMRDTHNDRRETLALGQITDNTGTALPPATNMNYLNWNCTLEKEAHDFLRSCPTEGYQRPSDDLPAQNFYRDTITSGLTYNDMHKKAVTEWWKPSRKVPGPGTSVRFLPEHNDTTIKSFTLIGWASTKEIGCSIAKCGNEWVEACRYYPPGNKVDDQMYVPGKACSQCTTLGAGPCDPKLGLCISKE